MPINVAVGLQVPAIEISKPVLVSLPSVLSGALHDLASGYNFGRASFHENTVAYVDFSHGGDMFPSTHKSHAEADEVVGIVPSE